MISVIVPVYNVKPYLLRCLDSLEKQTSQDIEFIIVNDGSTDGSDEICKTFLKNKDKFRYFSKPNGGLMSAWMEGLKHAKGTYIGFVDSDDFIEPEMFAKLGEQAEKYDADMVMCKFVYDHIQNEKVLAREVQDNSIKEGYYEGTDLRNIKLKMLPKSGRKYISPSRCNKIIKKEILEKNLKYCDVFIASGEDVNIILPCFFSVNSFYYVDEALYHYVKNSASITYKFNDTLKEQYLRLLEKTKEALKDYSLDIETNEWCQVVNSYGIMLLRTMLNAKISRTQRKAQIRELCKCDLFFESARKTDMATCNKWERAYIHAIKKKSARRFGWLLTLSKIKNKMRMAYESKRNRTNL